MHLQKRWKTGSRIIAMSVTLTMVAGLFLGCGSSTKEETAPGQSTAAVQTETAPQATEAANAETGLHVLTKEDVKGIFNPSAVASFQDSTMKSPVMSGSSDDLTLTEEEKGKIRGMKLKIGLEQDHLDDAMKLIQQAFRDQCADLGIELSDIWMATEMDGGSQMNDYQNFLAIADQYDGFFTCLSDASINTDILKKIMQKTNVGFMLAVPFDLDWTDKHFVGITDINAREAGVSSAKAAIKILNGQGKIGTVGYVNGKNGSINTCYQRYIGWDEVFKENPDVPVVQAWYDNPADSKAVVSSLLAANPDIKTLLVDWSYPPGDNALQVAQELGLKPGKDISVVTIDFDNVVTIPMASKGNDSYAAACVAQTWYTAGANLVKMYAKHILQEGKNVKFVASNPAPVTTPMNVKTNFRIIVPETVSAIPMPKEIEALTEQWSLEELGVENIWK